LTLHLLGLPWSQTTKEWESCAYSARTRVLGSMLARYGTVILYGGERNESRVTEHVPIVDRAWQRRHFPTHTPNDVFSDYDPSRPHWVEFNVRAADAIRKRARPGDILGITMGTSQQLAAQLLADLEVVPVEVGVGYKGVWAPFRVYESWAWRMYHAGLAEGRTGEDTASDVRNFDSVIPRAYEVFPDFPEGKGDGGYFLFLGRVVARKGPHIAAEVCRRIGARLVVAGQGVASSEPGRITGADGTVLEGDVEYAGVVGPEERAKLLGGAIAALNPTLYNGPFEGTHVEALLTGTPVLSTDWGVFTETITDGVNGWRCPTLADFLRGARAAGNLSRAAIRRDAIARYGTAAVGPVFDAFLNRVATLRRSGWYESPLEPVRRAA
jgi:glycosyltransferase involved in cell wall biosynthesis